MSDRSALNVTVKLTGNYTEEQIKDKIEQRWDLVADDIADESGTICFFDEEASIGTCDEMYETLISEGWDLDVLITQEGRYEYSGRIALYAGSIGQHAIMDAYESTPMLSAQEIDTLKEQLPIEYHALLDNVTQANLRNHFGVAI